MNKKIHFFNMIEVLLALAVIAIGMTSVLGLFPVGLNASRNAVAENLSADVADQMATYLRVMGESSLGAYGYTFTDSTTTLPDYSSLNITNDITIDIRDGASGVITSNIQTLSDDFLSAYKAGGITTTTPPFSRVAPGWAIFTPSITSPTPADLRRRVYFIVQGPNCTESAGNHPVDYSAMMLVWKETVQIQRMESGGGWSLWPPTADADAYTYSGKVNIELSWPLELPYAERKKRYYQVVIAKP